MKRLFSIISVIIVIVILISVFSSCAKPNNADSESKSESASNETLTDNPTDGNTDKNTENDTQDGISSDGGNSGNGTAKYTREGDYIYFGEYPQSLKKSDVTVENSADSRGYFLGSDNAYYAKVVASPYESGYKFSTDVTVMGGSEYYFKVEPIKWRILSESDGSALLLCESILENKAFDAQSNNYKESDVHAWLNDSFYNIAFNELQRGIIQTVSLDNSVNSTGHSENPNVCENTEDKIFLLSYAEVTSANYGFSDDISRMRFASDYALAKGTWISTSDVCEYYGSGLWMLRTPNNTYTHFIRECAFNGEVTDGGTNLVNSFFGVVPALKIKL